MRVNLGHKARYHFSDTRELERDELLISRLGGIPVKDAALIGCIDLKLARQIGASTDLVKIGPITMSKLASKHTMALHYDLGLLYHGFLTGRVQQHGARHLIFLFRDPRKPIRTLKAVVKSTRDGSELLVVTYHVCTGKQLTTALKRGTVLRNDGTWG